MPDQGSAFVSTGFAVPRFVSLRVGKVYARTGPGKQYPIRYVYQRKGLPVEIILEYEGWRKIRDHEGGEGWVHQTLLTGRRTAFVQGDKAGESLTIRKRPKEASRPMARIENHAMVSIEKCPKGDWCYIKAAGYKGWVMRKNLWGVYENEFFD